MEYGQFCPVAKATEILGEKWTLLIIRELLMGGTRFNVLQRGLSLIFPDHPHQAAQLPGGPGVGGQEEDPRSTGLRVLPDRVLQGVVADHSTDRRLRDALGAQPSQNTGTQYLLALIGFQVVW